MPARQVFGDVVKGSAHVRPIAVGDWVEMVVDLDHGVANFFIWPCNPLGWGPPLPGRPTSSAEFAFGRRLACRHAKAGGGKGEGGKGDVGCGQGVAGPLNLNVGHFACVVLNSGVTLTLGS